MARRVSSGTDSPFLALYFGPNSISRAAVGSGGGPQPAGPSARSAARKAPARNRFGCIESMTANAGILGSLALAAGTQIQLETEVLWLGLGGLFELHDDVITVAFRQAGGAGQRITLLGKLEAGFAGLRVGLQRHT